MSENTNGANTIVQTQAALASLLAEFDRICKQLDIPYVLFAGTMLGAVRHQGFIPWDDDVDVMMLREDYDRFLAQAEKLLDQEKFFLQKEFSPHWPMFFTKLRLNGTAYLERYHPKDPECHQGLYLDIFACDYAAPGKLRQRLQFFASKVVIAKCLDARGYDTDSKLKKVFMALCRVLPLKPFLKLAKGKARKNGQLQSFLGGAHGFEQNIYPAEWFDQRTELLFNGKAYPVSAAYDAFLTRLYGDYMQLPSPEQRRKKQHAILIDLERSYEEYRHYRDDMQFHIYTRSIR